MDVDRTFYMTCCCLPSFHAGVIGRKTKKVGSSRSHAVRFLAFPPNLTTLDKLFKLTLSSVI